MTTLPLTRHGARVHMSRVYASVLRDAFHAALSASTIGPPIRSAAIPRLTHTTHALADASALTSLVESTTPREIAMTRMPIARKAEMLAAAVASRKPSHGGRFLVGPTPRSLLAVLFPPLLLFFPLLLLHTTRLFLPLPLFPRLLSLKDGHELRPLLLLRLALRRPILLFSLLELPVKSGATDVARRDAQRVLEGECLAILGRRVRVRLTSPAGGPNSWL
mmetsp:Transcript_14777/g.48322  ORF Transcript_14777/g.48322 Transcript_14777/m.48322 type:complete len:220 (+) Transcript_14777:77-736(+)